MKVLVWNENIHEKEMPEILNLYPSGLHEYIASILRDETTVVSTATLDDPECGLTDEVLKETDVLIWWGHAGHDRVPDEIAERVHQYIMRGTGFIALHSAHHSKVFKKLMGTTCNLKWRDGTRERIWTIKPNHPIAQGVDETFVLDPEEMYGEPFDIPEPTETIFMGWFNGGEVFRSGCTWIRGNGKIFYFQPGHETNASLTEKNVQQILKNAVRWACPISKNLELDCPLFAPLEQ